MRLFLLTLLVLGLAACDAVTAGATSRPNPAFEAMRTQFEREILSIEGNYSDAEELRNAALPVAQRIYGANWGLVRAEALRSIAALPEIDLTRYSVLAPERPQIDLSESDLGQMLSPGGLAAWRAYDANMVAFTMASMSVRPFEQGDSASMIGAKFALVGPRAYRGRLNGGEVLAVRYYRSLVTIPYMLTAEGLIKPDLQQVGIYPLQR